LIRGKLLIFFKLQECQAEDLKVNKKSLLIECYT